MLEFFILEWLVSYYMVFGTSMCISMVMEGAFGVTHTYRSSSHHTCTRIRMAEALCVPTYSIGKCTVDCTTDMVALLVTSSCILLSLCDCAIAVLLRCMYICIQAEEEMTLSCTTSHQFVTHYNNNGTRAA